MNPFMDSHSEKEVTKCRGPALRQFAFCRYVTAELFGLIDCTTPRGGAIKVPPSFLVPTCGRVEKEEGLAWNRGIHFIIVHEDIFGEEYG